MMETSVNSHLRLSALLGLACLAACNDPASYGEWQNTRSADLQPEPSGLIAAGEEKFDTPFPGTNGRSCGDCHVEGESRALPPQHVQDLLESDPDDPLFADIDVDVLGAEQRTFNNFSLGLARLILPLPDNMDVIDLAGNVITPPDRKIEVWRAIPSIQNTSYTGPYLHDGRAETLEAQALGAIEAHSLNTHAIGEGALFQIAEFERASFSSDRARYVQSRGLALHSCARATADSPDAPAFIFRG